MDFPFQKIVESEDETRKIANEFLEEIETGIVVTLNGDLGTGKTFFVKSLLNNFGIEDVTSPTFSIVNTYSKDNIKINHFDFYRIKKEAELFDIGFDEYLSDSNSITFIEWADLFPGVLPKNGFAISIKHLENFKREINIEKNN